VADGTQAIWRLAAADPFAQGAALAGGQLRSGFDGEDQEFQRAPNYALEAPIRGRRARLSWASALGGGSSCLSGSQPRKHGGYVKAHRNSPESHLASLTGVGRGSGTGVRRYISRIDRKSGSRYNSSMDDEMIAQVKALVTQVSRTSGFGEVRIIIEKGRPRRVITAVEEWLEDRGGASPTTLPPGRPGSARMT